MENKFEKDDLIDLEQFAKEGKNPPKSGVKCIIKIDQHKYTVNKECMTGAEILELAGKSPITRFQLNVKLKGKIEKVEYKQIICFSLPGIEKFMTIPLDQTEGTV